jgi:hypothetical protein
MVKNIVKNTNRALLVLNARRRHHIFSQQRVTFASNAFGTKAAEVVGDLIDFVIPILFHPRWYAVVCDSPDPMYTVCEVKIESRKIRCDGAAVTVLIF